MKVLAAMKRVKAMKEKKQVCVAKKETRAMKVLAAMKRVKAMKAVKKAMKAVPVPSSSTGTGKFDKGHEKAKAYWEKEIAKARALQEKYKAKMKAAKELALKRKKKAKAKSKMATVPAKESATCFFGKGER